MGLNSGNASGDKQPKECGRVYSCIDIPREKPARMMKMGVALPQRSNDQGSACLQLSGIFMLGKEEGGGGGISRARMASVLGRKVPAKDVAVQLRYQGEILA
jgi:hypothetical protein